MKGDFSRQTFDKKKRYIAALMQQGRVQLDADWNEQQAITLDRFESLTQDAVGPSGAPVFDAGFAITIKSNKLWIGKGRYYVGGVLCENFEDVPYDQQPDLLSPPDPAQAMSAAGAQKALVYLDTWQRHVTALDDRRIREKALGGPDTATRLKTVWQVKVLPIPPNSIDLERVQTELAALLSGWKTTAAWANPDRDGALAALGVYNARVTQIVNAGLDSLLAAQRGDPQAMQKTLQTFQTDTQQVYAALVGKSPSYAFDYTLRLQKEFKRVLDEGTEINCRSRFLAWEDLVAPSTGMLNARTVAQQSSDDPCVIPSTAGYQRLENQLYRVEVHRGGGPGVATFKWSRDNGSVVTAVEEINGKNVTVQDTGRDDVLGFAGGQWVEVVDDLNELSGNVGQLVQIDTVNQATRVITMKTALAAVNQSLHPKLRRWDQAGVTAGADGVQMGNDWTPLESGIQVKFTGGTYRPGDYWLIPARTATGEIEWPPFEEPNVNPVAQPPLTVRHRYCALATFRLTNAVLHTLGDCRRLFPPLSPPAMRVLGINWGNDDFVTLDRLNSEGLRVQLDDVPSAASVKDATFIVTAESQMPFDVTLPRLKPPGTETFDVSSKISLILEGTTSTESNVIRWRPSVATLNKLFVLLRVRNPLLVRVTLKGHAIWSDHGGLRLHLDGQSFGQPGVRGGGRGPCTALGFPSGAGERASDFESWFHLDLPAYGYFYGLSGIGSDLVKPPPYPYPYPYPYPAPPPKPSYPYPGAGIGGRLL